MRMKYIITTLVFVVATTMTGCKKWLDVSPKTQVSERDLLETESGFKDALIGAYISLAQANTYGQNLTMGFLDAMGQRYNTTSTSHIFYRASRYEYSDASTKAYIANIWSGMYTTIANVDNILTQAEAKQAVFSGKNFNMIKGESLALRALLHFDLLRLFGPAPIVDGSRKCIPYPKTFGNTVYPLLTVNEVIDNCLADLAAAEQLLSVDKSIRVAFPEDPFLSYTRNRMNYWAVKGLQARILLYKGDKAGAMTNALEVINNGAANFPFVSATAASAATNRDKTYSTELLYSINTYKINDYLTPYFKTTVVNGTPILNTTSANTTALYETTTGGSSDIRFNYLFTSYPSGYATTKYHQEDLTNESLTKLIPVIRLSEMYYIAAECAATPTDGVGYINTIRSKRGLAALSTTIAPAALEAEILKEYKKEMYAEGQLYYYFKRKNAAKVDGSTITMTDATWIFPLPETEIEFGKRF
jgi:hypothetical protein